MARKKEHRTEEEARALLDEWAAEQTEIFDAREALLKDARARAELFRCAGIGAKVSGAGRYTRKTTSDEDLVTCWLWVREQNPTDTLHEVCELTAKYAAEQIKREEPFNGKYIQNRVGLLLEARRKWNRGRGPTLPSLSQSRREWNRGRGPTKKG